MPSLALHNLVADYGDQRVLGPLDLEIVRGQRVALVGKSGAGKSTLLSLMHQRWRKTGVALMPQDLGLVPTLSVFHNVFMGGLHRRANWYNLVSLAKPFKRDLEEVKQLLAQLDMKEKCWSPTGELSGGQRQRVAAARAIYQQSDFLLADEPASALDGPMAERVMAALTQAHPTAVLALHDVELALRYSDRIVGIADGQIALDESSAKVTAQDLLALY